MTKKELTIRLKRAEKLLLYFKNKFWGTTNYTDYDKLKKYFKKK